MLANAFFLIGLVVALSIGFLYFRDLGDVIQILVKVKRKDMIRFIRNENRLIALGLGGALLMTVAHLGFGAGPRWLWVLTILLCVVFYGFPYVWVHLGLRNQQEKAQFYPISEALKYITPSTPVIVIENNGHARAHPDSEILRPHLAGDEKGLDGENVIMTYCAVANLGLGYKPEIDGKKVDLEVLAQHGNNLILRDNNTGEPIQHIYGFREADMDPNADGPVCPLKPSLAMQPWPTFRMTLRGFQKAYPEGEVFLNKPSSNPLLKLVDFAADIAFGWGIGRQHKEAEPIMNNMTHSDDRLHKKTYVWGINIGNDAVCWTDDFVIANGNLINTEVGGKPVVVAWDPLFESLGAWYNDTGSPVTEIDIYGKTPAGNLQRVETLKSGLFWLVWVEFFPHTDINRVGDGEDQKAA